MRYFIPACRKCNTALMVVEEYTHQHVREIRTNGKVGKIGRQHSRFTTNKLLKCVDCGRTYELKLDDENRVVRGRQITVSRK
jgi:uncharacterized protein YbaR (Trm112 family)